MTTLEEEKVAALTRGGRKRRRRRTKRKSRKSLLKKKRTKRRRRRKSRRKSKRRRRSRRRRRRQKGGNSGVPGSGRLPTGQLTRQNFGHITPIPQKGQKGGSALWRNLGFTWPKDTYNDSMTFLKNIKHTYVGDRGESTSNVLKQPIADARPPSMKPTDYLKAFNKADASTADNLQI